MSSMETIFHSLDSMTSLQNTANQILVLCYIKFDVWYLVFMHWRMHRRIWHKFIAARTEYIATTTPDQIIVLLWIYNGNFHSVLFCGYTENVYATTHIFIQRNRIGFVLHTMLFMCFHSAMLLPSFENENGGKCGTEKCGKQLQCYPQWFLWSFYLCQQTISHIQCLTMLHNT